MQPIGDADLFHLAVGRYVYIHRFLFVNGGVGELILRSLCRLGGVLGLFIVLFSAAGKQREQHAHCQQHGDKSFCFHVFSLQLGVVFAIRLSHTHSTGDSRTIITISLIIAPRASRAHIPRTM